MKKTNKKFLRFVIGVICIIPLGSIFSRVYQGLMDTGSYLGLAYLMAGHFLYTVGVPLILDGIEELEKK